MGREIAGAKLQGGVIHRLEKRAWSLGDNSPANSVQGWGEGSLRHNFLQPRLLSCYSTSFQMPRVEKTPKCGYTWGFGKQEGTRH